jgi:uncharacterized protein with FMN-binding domain
MSLPPSNRPLLPFPGPGRKTKTHAASALSVLLAAAILGCATAQIIGGPIPDSRLKDGIYDGTARNGPVRVTAKVTIQDRRIAAIELTEHRHWRGAAAETLIPGRIIEAQSTRVDAVSGATASSTAIMNAVETAVRKAR